MATKTDLLRLIRQNCAECMGGTRAIENEWPVKNPADIANCTAPECPFYPFRMGKDTRPTENQRIAGERLREYWRNRQAIGGETAQKSKIMTG